MSRGSRTPRTPRTRVRRQRSVSELLLSITLGLEAAVVFFVALAMYGLDILEPPLAFGGGAVAILVFVAVAGRLRHSWAVWIGWALQLFLIALGFLLPAMFGVGLGALAFWTYCWVQGRRIDRQKAAWAAAEPAQPADPPEPDPTTPSTDSPKGTP